MHKPWWAIFLVPAAFVACSGDSERSHLGGSRGGESGTEGTTGGQGGTAGDNGGGARSDGGAGEGEGGGSPTGGRSGSAGQTSGSGGRDTGGTGGSGGASGSGSCQCTGLLAVRPDAEIECVNGRCELDPEDCVAGRGDCDGDFLNGCEVWTDFDLSNCGACGVVCPTLAGCNGGRCEFDACDPGYARCDSDNACKPLDTARHCGACDHEACSFGNTLPTCSAPDACLPPICIPGHANCSGDAACETNITSSGGACYPTPLTSYVLGVGGSHINVAVDAGGALIVAGGFDSSGDFDPTSGVDVRSPTGIDGSAFISIYTSSGAYVRTLTLDGGSSWIDDVELGPSGTFLVAGTHRGVTDLDPGPGERLSNSHGQDEGFVLTFDADYSLSRSRTLLPTDTNAGVTVSDIAIDALGDLYVTGSFFGPVDFAPDRAGGELATEDLAVKAYTVKYRDGIEWLWTPSGDCPSSGDRLSVSGERLWVASTVTGSCQFDEAGEFTTPADTQGVAVVELSRAGEVTNLGLLDRVEWTSALATTQSSVFVVGLASSVVDLDPGNGVDQRILPSGSGYAVKLAGDGTFAFDWAQTFGGFEVDGAATTGDDRLLLAGSGPRNSTEVPPTGTVLLVNADESPGFTLDLGPNRSPRTVAVGGGVLAVAGHESNDSGSVYFVERYTWDGGSR